MPNDKNAQSKNPVAKPAANSELKTDKQPKEKKGLLEGLNLRKRFSRAAAFVIRYQVVIMAVFVGGLLGITAIRMLHYANPTMNQDKYQQDLSQFKTVHIDKKTVDRINQLNDTGVAPGTDITNRTNPFAE
jgi:hypothetical protein